MEEQAKGTFQQEGRKDVLSMAFGKPEHPGRVRGVGFGIGISKFFGRAPPTRKEPCTKEEAFKEVLTSIGKSWFQYKAESGADVSEMPQFLENIFASALNPATTSSQNYHPTQDLGTPPTRPSSSSRNIITPSTPPMQNVEVTFYVYLYS